MNTSLLAFIGLGTMGYPMAGRLSRRGERLRVHNRSAAKAERWVAEFGGEAAATPADAARGASCVFLCVGDDRDVDAVVRGPEGVLGVLAPGAVIVDHTTTSARIARTMADAARERGVAFLDAPVSGGQAGAQQGILTVMVGGDRAAFELISPLLAAYARQARLLGGSGSGQLCKMVNQILLAGLIQGLSEGMAFARKAGLDIEAVVETLRLGAAQSWQLEHRARTMARDEFDFGFAVDLMRKDLRIAREQAATLGAALPVTEIVQGYYDELSGRGAGRADTSSLITLLPS